MCRQRDVLRTTWAETTCGAFRPHPRGTPKCKDHFGKASGSAGRLSALTPSVPAIPLRVCGQMCIERHLRHVSY